MIIDLKKVLGLSKDCLQSRSRMRGLILDLYPQATREMNVLLDVYESGVPRKIKNKGTISDLQYETYIKQIVDEYGLQEQYVVEALNSWIDVCIAPGTSAKLKRLSNTNKRSSDPYNSDEIIHHEPIITKSVKDVSGSEYDFETKVVGSDQIEIVKFKGFDEKELIVPSEISGKQVVGIGAEAYKACKTVNKITIAEGIQYIGNGAFADCQQLSVVILPSTLKRIGDMPDKSSNSKYRYLYSSFSSSKGAFSNTKIKVISLPVGLSYLGEGTFQNCSYLENIDIPNRITVISDYTFYGCTALKDVLLPDHLSLIGKMAFDRCSFRKIVLPNSVIEIKDYAFANNNELSDVRLNEGLQTIGSDVFQNTKKMQKIVMPSTVKKFGNEMFNVTGWYQPYDRRYKGYSTNTKNTSVVFYCYAGSAAIEYARKEGYPIKNAAELN